MKTLIIAALLLPGAALADCGTERDLLFGAMERNGWEIADEGSFSQMFSNCRLRNLELREDSVSIDVGLLEWSLQGLDNLATGRGELRLEGRVDDLRIVPSVDDPWIGYMLSEQNRRSLIDGSLKAEWSLDEGRLEVETLEIDLPGDNAFEMSMRVFGLTPAAIGGRVDELGTLSLESFAFDLENNGFADGLILGALVGHMSDVPGTPETVIAATKAEVAEAVEALPASLFLDGAREELLEVIADAPVPWGKLRMSITSDPKLSVARLLPLAMGPASPDAIEQAFEGVRVFIDYTPTTNAE